MTFYFLRGATKAGVNRPASAIVSARPVEDIGYRLARLAWVFLAIFFLAGDSFSALAFPLFNPPSLPRATAAGFFLVF